MLLLCYAHDAMTTIETSPSQHIRRCPSDARCCAGDAWRRGTSVTWLKRPGVRRCGQRRRWSWRVRGKNRPLLPRLEGDYALSPVPTPLSGIFAAIYIERQTILHGECFYHDDCEPDETEELIRETLQFIRDAEALAES